MRQYFKIYYIHILFYESFVFFFLFLLVNEDGVSECNSKPEKQETQEDEDHHRSDEQVNICLECRAPNLKTLKRRFLRISSQATITHLKKFVALKIYNNISRFKEVKYNKHLKYNIFPFFTLKTTIKKEAQHLTETYLSKR